MPDDRADQSRITEFWSTVAAGYDAHPGNVPTHDGAEHQAWVRAIAGLLPAAPADVLDIATGTGFIAMIAARLGHRVTAIDLAEPMLAAARAETQHRDLRITFLSGDAVAPDFPKRSFDALISRNLVWTLRDPETALNNWHELIRPGGRLVAIDGFWFPTESGDSEPLDGLFEQFYNKETRRLLPGWNYFSVEPIAALFERAGFADVATRYLDEVRRVARDPPAQEPSYALVGFVR
jgi:ubiquinone/menaquinone biosynthesis C-methylase UbiE